MLFNSYIFIFGYLPITILVFFYLARTSRVMAAAWLAAASLFFYGWWNPAYVGLLLLSIIVNYAFGMWIANAGVRHQYKVQKHLLIAAITFDLGLLAYYKYANFFLNTVNAIADTHYNLGAIILPLGISFFTFTQIAFLVDTYRGEVREYNFIHYILFVTYFPHLIAGPVLHHKEMMPQFAQESTYRWNVENFSIGLSIFFIGLFKKVVLADNIAVYVGPTFSAAAAGSPPTLIEAWGGALCYTLQLYFDFSGYSDMAIGLSRLFGVVLPLNFASPYRAVNIIEFWRRWHMTLSRFLRDYLYIPLGGNRKGKARRYANLLITMLLGGLWHGAGWTYVIWGGLHGLYLVINHAWHGVRKRLGHDLAQSTYWGRALGILITFFAVVVAWVFFRAESFEAAILIIKGMLGLNGILLPEGWLPKLGSLGQWLAANGVKFGFAGGTEMRMQVLWIVGLLAVVWLLPNTQQIMAAFRPALDTHRAGQGPAPLALQWRPSRAWATATAVLTVMALTNLNKVSEFLYFQF